MMTYSTASVADVTAFRGRDFAFGEFRRAVFGAFFIGVGSVAAIGATIGCVTVAAACIVAGLHTDNSNLELKRPFALGAASLTKLETVALERGYRDVAGAVEASSAEASSAARTLIEEAPVHAVKVLIFRAPATQSVAAQPAIAAQPVVPQLTIAQRFAALTGPDQTNLMPLPAPRPPAAAQTPAARESARVHVALAQPETTGSIPSQAASASGSSLQRVIAPQSVNNLSPLLANVDSHTAIYDIEAHVVYLPSGERMEAHSGLGEWIDDPHHVNAKMHGATPPNVYDLAMRDGLFHGVEALRLNPVGDTSMYGRDGILAHPYMLGASGQSFGCVSFKDYQAFLRAFKKGEVNRLVVVPHLDPGALTAHASRDGTNRFAFN
jgi:Tlde1 domain